MELLGFSLAGRREIPALSEEPQFCILGGALVGFFILIWVYKSIFENHLNCTAFRQLCEESCRAYNDLCWVHGRCSCHPHTFKIRQVLVS